MLGLGAIMMKHPVTGKSIVRDGLVLQHNYNLSSVEPLSSGAAAINADADGADFIDVGLIPITTNDVTVSAWVYITDFINSCAIFSNRHGSSPNQGFAVRTATSPDKFQIITDEATTGSQTTSSSGKNTNQWYHVCAVLDRDGSQYLYVDGVLEGSTDISGLADSLTHTTSARIGKNFSNYEMNGYVCNVGYWNAALSQAQVKSIMNKNYDSLSASEKTNLVSWWNLDSTTTEVATAVYDNHGGETFGSEILNQPILTGTGWSNANGTVSDDGVGTVTVPADGTYGYFRGNPRPSDYTEGAIYKAVVTVQGTAGKDIRVRSEIGSDNGGLTATTGRITLTGSLQTETFYFISNDQDDDFRIERHNSDEAYSFDIHSASLKKLNGNTGTLS